MESNNVNLIELLRQFSPSISFCNIHLVETMTYPRVMLSKNWVTNNGLCNHKPYKNAILSSVCDAISELIDNKKRIGRVSFFLYIKI